MTNRTIIFGCLWSVCFAQGCGDQGSATTGSAVSAQPTSAEAPGDLSSARAKANTAALPPQAALPNVSLSPEIPADVSIPPNFPLNPINFFDDYSWKIFVALNWPAAKGRGIADTTKKAGDATEAVVWQTWKSAFDLFQPNGGRPSNWDAFEGATPCAPEDASAPGAPQLVAFSKVELEDFNQAGFGDPVGPLISQNRTYVRYETKLNKVEYEKILGAKDDPKSQLYLAKNLPNDNHPDKVVFPVGAIEVKAAWREIKDGDATLSRYYHVAALLKDPVSGRCRKANVGLVGLHIAQKTQSRPQWIWSTFEHVDNLTPPPGGATSTFNDPKGPQTGATINRAPEPIDRDSPPKSDPDPVQCVRTTSADNPTIPPSETQRTNELYRAALRGTVWENYQLVMTQWPVRPFTDGKQSPGAGTPFPARNVANVTMETYHQGTSCLGCHVASDDTDFAWFLRVRAFTPDVAERKRTLNGLASVMRQQSNL